MSTFGAKVEQAPKVIEKAAVKPIRTSLFMPYTPLEQLQCAQCFTNQSCDKRCNIWSDVEIALELIS
jgi:hypothetical protein